MDVSKLELKIEMFFKENGIEYDRHKKVILWENKNSYVLNTLKGKRKLNGIVAYIDFFLPLQNAYIEVKGYNLHREREFVMKKKLIVSKVKNYQVVYNWKQFIEHISTLDL